jgi:hypothetical protein
MLSFCAQGNCWRKVRAQKGVTVPRGRRGHTALVHQGTMLVYGGYQDLRGSSNELWGFHFGKLTSDNLLLLILRLNIPLRCNLIVVM